MMVLRLFFWAMAIALLLPACAPTRQPRGEVKTSGFLHDYSILEAGGEDQAKLRYVDPKANFSQYQVVLVDSVTLWSGPELAKLKPEQKQALVDHAYTALATALGRSFTIAKAPGAGTLRVRAAITEATSSAVVPDVVATIIPQVRLIGTLGGLAANTAATVGEASGEVEVTDSLTNQVLAAGVDRRVGQRSLQGVFGKWNDVEEAWDHWAEQLRARLVEAGAGHAPKDSK
jgi:hypothetical protein